MRREIGWQVRIGAALVVLSAVLYLTHYLIFRDLHHIFIYLLGDVAFVPLEVLLVTLVMHELLKVRERKNRMEKLNMIIGVFFSEVGRELLTRLSNADPKLKEVRSKLAKGHDWSEIDFKEAVDQMMGHRFHVDINLIDLKDLRRFLMGNREFLVRLLENPSLMEHETFTDLLWAVFHLDEELEHRDEMDGLPEPDLKHLAGDMERAYKLLVHQWLSYMKHLKESYPYLFSLAMRTNPFIEESSAVISR
ncbi:TPA: hypothetical protein ENG04_12375 [Candidatus Poribacteria bacterium]|nr:hypothetical protein [Candidatus Poribacteria bacterium]HEX30866.1 hypothetical protein [Candidatus Poribacteria bacterium]